MNNNNNNNSNNNKNQILPNILINKIIKYIVYYLYKNKINSYLKLYGFHEYRYSFRHLHVEVLNYVMVSKKWKEISSIHLFNSLNIHNFYSLYQFIGDSSIKLISKFNSVRIYNSFNNYIQDKVYRDIYKYKNILVNQSIGFLDLISSKDYSLIGNEILINSNLDIRLLSIEPFIIGDSCNGIRKKFNELSISRFIGSNQIHLDKALELINDLQPKRLVVYCDYAFEGDDLFDQLELPEYLVRKLSKLITNPNLKSFYMDSTYLEPFHLLDIDNKTTRLKELELRMKFNEMIYVINSSVSGSSGGINSNSGESDYNQLFIKPNNIQNDWDQMINKLIQNSTIKLLSINQSQDNEYPNEFIPIVWNSNINTSVLTQGFKLLFSNPSCSIETLQLVYQVTFIDQLFMDGLKENKSITTLIFYQDINFNFIFNQLFPSNKTIRNLKFYNSDINTFNSLIKLFKDINGLDLYSITFEFRKQINWFAGALDKIIFKIKESSLSIKEFNFYYEAEAGFSSLGYQIVLNNNNNNNSNNSSTLINLKHQSQRLK